MARTKGSKNKAKAVVVDVPVVPEVVATPPPPPRIELPMAQAKSPDEIRSELSQSFIPSTGPGTAALNENMSQLGEEQYAQLERDAAVDASIRAVSGGKVGAWTQAEYEDTKRKYAAQGIPGYEKYAQPAQTQVLQGPQLINAIIEEWQRLRLITPEFERDWMDELILGKKTDYSTVVEPKVDCSFSNDPNDVVKVHVVAVPMNPYFVFVRPVGVPAGMFDGQLSKARAKQYQVGQIVWARVTDVNGVKKYDLYGTYNHNGERTA